MNFEMPASDVEVENNNTEQEPGFESKEQAKEFNAKAEEVGEKLENTNPASLTPENLHAAYETIEKVLGAVLMVAGSAATASEWMAYDYGQISGVENVVAGAVAALGITVSVVGLHKLLNGTRRFWGELTPDQKSRLKN
jgi:hypothetical protein